MKIFSLGALAALLSVAFLSVLFAPPIACAQPEQPTTMQVDFEPATPAQGGAQHENLPGGLMMVGAYAIIWLLLLGFVIRLGMLHSGARKEVAQLERTLKEGLAKASAK